MNLRRMILLLLVLVLTLSGCTSSGYQNDNKRAEALLVPSGEKGFSLTRTNISLEEDQELLVNNAEGYTIRAAYPVLSRPHVDQAAKELAMGFVDRFESAAMAQTSGPRAELMISYTIDRPQPHLVGMLFTIVEKHGDDSQTTLVALNADLSKDLVLDNQKLFASTPYPLISKALADYFNASPQFSHKLNEPKLKTALDNTVAGGGIYLLRPYSFSILFPANSLLDRSHQDVVVDIPYNAFSEVLAPDYMALKDIVAPAGEDAYIVTDQLPTPYVTERYKDELRRKGVNVNDIDPQKPMIALTFDDGPNAESTLSILDTLKAHNARATFFVLGSRMDEHQDVLLRMQDEHHDIGSHSYSHADLGVDDKDLIDRELRESNKKAQKILGHEFTLLRPTFGSMSPTLRNEAHMPLIMWSVDTKDWQSRDAERVYEEIMRNPQDGQIILMHDIYDSTAEAVAKAVPELIKQGFQLVTVRDMYYLRGQALTPGQDYYGVPAPASDQNQK